MSKTKILSPTPCPVCGSTDGCKPSGGLLQDAPLSVDDWRRVYEFCKYVELPFLHQIMAQAVERKRIEKAQLDS